LEGCQDANDANLKANPTEWRNDFIERAAIIVVGRWREHLEVEHVQF